MQVRTATLPWYGWLLLGLLGCSTLAQRPGQSYTDPMLLDLYEGRIVHGETTERQIRDWFGPPWLATRDNYRRPQLIYRFGANEALELRITLRDGVVIGHQVHATPPGPEG
jgi:hypothetical protein